MQTHEKITIKDIAYGGSGIGELSDGRVCFVPFTAIGDKITVKIVKEKKRFVEGEIVSIEEKGLSRVEPKCPLFSKCGGCNYQHLNYDEQLKIKQNQLKDVIKRIGRLTLPKINLIPSEQQYGYRNKLRLSPYRDEQQKIHYGLYSNDNRTIIPIEECPLAQQEVNEKIAIIKTTPWGRKNALLPKPSKATIRKSSEDEAMIYYGKVSPNYPWIKEKILNKNFRVPLESFFQVNRFVAEKLLERVSHILEKLPIKTVIDTFCGAGFLTSNTTKKVVGIEIDNLAIAAAKYNAHEYDIRATYLIGNVAKYLSKQIKRYDAQHTAVIVDPPRNGCSKEVLETLLKDKPKFIIYVSCDCSTLGRDLKNLSQSYKINDATLLDMFPQTAHFETIILLEKK